MKPVWLLLLLSGCRTSLPGGSIEGRVVIVGESQGGGIVVTASGAETTTATTDPGGSYRFGALTLGPYLVSASVPDTVERERSVTLVLDGPTDAPELRFTPAGALHGRATRGGAPSGNGGILISVSGTDAIAVTDDGGGYRLPKVPAGKYELTAQLAGYRPGGAKGQEVRWAQSTEVPPIDLVVQAGHAALRGMALLYGASDHGGTRVLVRGTGLTTTTAADGSWSIDGVPEGTYSLEFENGDYRELVPEVEALVGSEGLVIDQALYSLLLSPLTLFQARRLHTEQEISGYNVSPDGTRLLYLGQMGTRPALRSVPLDPSGDAVTLAENWDGSLTPYSYQQAQFSPDSRRVAYTRGGILELIDAAGGTPQRLAHGANSYWWAPDSARLGYLGPDPQLGTAAIFAVGIGGSAPMMVVSEPKLTNPVQSFDGNRFLYRTDVDDYWRLGTVKMVSVGGGAPVVLGWAAWDATLRSDGRWALILSNVNTNDGSSDLGSVDLASGDTHALASHVSHYPGVLFAGDRVVYGDTRTLYSVPVGGGAPTTLATVTDWLSSYKISPTSDQVGYFSECQTNMGCSLWVVPAGGGAPSQIGSGVFDYNFSADSQKLAFTTEVDSHGLGRLWLGGVGQAARALDEQAYGYYSHFSPDGGHLVYPRDVTTDSHGLLNVIALSDGSIVTLGKDVLVYDVHYSPDGTRLAFQSQPPGGVKALSLAPLDGGPAIAVIDNLSGYTFTSRGALLALRGDASPPYRFQNGFYLLQP